MKGTQPGVCNACDDVVENNCGLFDFMATTMGIKVLHPGGYVSTGKLAELCRLNPHAHVLDVACGTGTTSFYLAKKYGCRVSGIDISSSLIKQANERKKKKQSARITFQQGNALQLPYDDNTFDCAVSQAFFVLIDDHERALSEICRVLKPGGYFGSLELGWFKNPEKEVYDDLVKYACEAMIPRMMKFEEWEEFFASGKLEHLGTLTFPMPAGVGKLLKTEGVINFIRIMFRMMTNRVNRQRMMRVQATFDKYSDYFGYGIFSFKKTLIANK